jgi:FAD/FMN-containing dehydrogenase
MHLVTADSTTISIPKLRDTLNGRVITPGDPDYDQARTVFVGGIDRHPAVIIKAADANDVARVVSLARETGLKLAVRSGGHSTAGHSVCEGGIVLDLSAMNALDIDVDHHTAWAQTGLTAGQYTTAADAYGLTTGFGDTGSVGLGGITLGGGIGYLVRKHGLSIDDLLAAELVSADGRLLRTDPETHPELFWAIRGGGGNFGVATRFQFRLHPVDHAVGGMLLLPATPEVIAAFVAEAETAPEELSTIRGQIRWTNLKGSGHSGLAGAWLAAWWVDVKPAFAGFEAAPGAASSGRCPHLLVIGCGLLPADIACLDVGGQAGSVRRTSSKSRPRSRTLASRPCRAAWSATGPAMVVWPCSSLVISSPSNQADQPLSRTPLMRIS